MNTITKHSTGSQTLIPNSLKQDSVKNTGGGVYYYNSQDTLTAQSDTAVISKDSVAPKPTPEQIRQWRWFREKKLVVGESRYMAPKESSRLYTLKEEGSGSLGLTNQIRNFETNDWLTLILIACVIIFGTVKKGYNKYLGYLFESLLNYNTSYRLFRERNNSILHAAFRLEVLFYVVFAIFLHQLIGFMSLDLLHANLKYYGSILLITLLYFVVKKFIYMLIGIVTESVEETREFIFNMNNFNRTLGLILFPLVALINYYPANNPAVVVFIGLLVVLVFYVFLLQRGFSILLKKQFSIFYLFLYLCTLEFLPLLLIYKVVVL